MSDSLRPHELQHTRPPCPSPTPGERSGHLTAFSGKPKGQQGKLFFIKYLMNVEEMLECHHFAIPNEITDAGNDYQ